MEQLKKEYASFERSPVIDPELRDLLPPMQACLAYLDNCQQINVYADPSTPGMLGEIERAALRGLLRVDCPDPFLGRTIRPAQIGLCR